MLGCKRLFEEAIMSSISRLAMALLLSLPLFGSAIGAGQKSGGRHELGESREYLALKGRMSAPKAADMDSAVSLDSLLARTGEKDWSMTKGGTVEGYVIQVEEEQDGDFHLALAAKRGETSTKNWIIVEVSPAWRGKNANLADASLRMLRNKKVHVSGWLLYEPEGEDVDNDPRGTRWELHPVTDIKVQDK
jgi:hypothetical protein